MRNLLVLYCFISGITSTFAQFATIGDAEHMAGSCIKLTNDQRYSEGIAYSTSTLDLTKSFQIEFDIYLGDKDDLGADGITFVIHNDVRGFEAFGTFGEFMGYGGRDSNFRSAHIAPSIAIEFDTYQNYWQNDPSSDHIAYLENGSNRHIQFWNNNDEDFNLEDDRLHSFRFRWNPQTHNITVYLDGITVYEGNRDLIQDVFNGNTQVIWGFTASTGNKYNLQYFCFRRLARL